MVSPIKLPFAGVQGDRSGPSPLCVCVATYISPSPLEVEEWSFHDQNIVFWGDRIIQLLVDQGDCFAFVNLLIIQELLVIAITPLSSSNSDAFDVSTRGRGFPRFPLCLSAPPNSSPGACYDTRRPPYPISRRHPSLIRNLTLGQDTPFFSVLVTHFHGCIIPSPWVTLFPRETYNIF